MPRLAPFFAIALSLGAEVRTITLREAVGLALKQNPDVALARLEERKAAEAVGVARDPFFPKAFVGSGLGYSSGIPMSIEGATPSIFQATGVGSVLNRPLTYKIAAARENRRTAALDTAAREEEVAYRTAELFLNAEKTTKALDMARTEAQTLESVLASVRAGVAEGRVLPIEAKKSELGLVRARYRAQALETNLRSAEDALAAVLGLDPGDQVHVAVAERPAPELPVSADAAVQAAVANSKELRSLESKLVAKGYDVRSAQAGWLPKFDLVAQYAMLSRANNYDKFFAHFQRNNAQIGMSLQLPLWPSPGMKAGSAQAEAEAAQLRIRLRNTRRRIEDDTRHAFDSIRQAEAAQQLARLDLEVARDQVSLLLAQREEGRATLSDLEQARVAETDKWLAFYDAAADLERARLNLLHQMGTLMAAME